MRWSIRRVPRRALAGGPRGSWRPSPELGRVLRIATLGLTVKKYPMCFATHRVIDATLDLVRAHGLAAADVEAVDARSA